MGSIKDKSVTVPMPAIVATILSLVAGAAQVIIVGHVVSMPEQWREFAVVVLVFFAGIGINPLVGDGFYAALKLPTWLAHLISAGLAAAATATTITGLSHLSQAIILGVLTVAAGLGFQPVAPIASPGAVAPPTPPEPAPAPAPAVVVPVVVTPPAQPHEAPEVAESADQGVIR